MNDSREKTNGALERADHPFRHPFTCLNTLLHPDRAWARGAAGSFLISAAARGVGIASTALLTRLLDPTGYGVYSYAYVIATVLALPVQFGIPTVVTREVAAAERLGRWGLARGVVRWAHCSVVGMSLIIGIGVTVYLVLISGHLKAVVLGTYFTALALVPLLALDALRASVLTGLRRVVLGRLPGDLLRPLFVLTTLVVVVIANPSLISSPLHAMIVMAGAAALAYVAGTLILVWVTPAAYKRARSQYKMRSWSVSALPIGLTSGIQLGGQYAGFLILGLYVTKADIGVYRIAILGAGLLLMTLSAVSAAFSPYFAGAAAAGDRREIRRLITNSARLSLLAALPIAIVFAVWGRQLLGAVFGAVYEPAYSPLMILVIGWLIHAGTGAPGIVLYMSGHERDVFLTSSISVAVNILLCFLFIPKYGMDAAAGASTLAGIALSAMFCYRVWKRHGIVCGPINWYRGGNKS